ncbi:hypothetical protein DL98DRAFT_660028 [Cadophora sp. DSE1049]|nr:hypothetical protein DL98DRAFT_660028 [Cadophora sp. DSE1049]
MRSSTQFLSLALSALSLTTLPLTHAATSSSSCYYPSGVLAPSNDVPCNTNTDGHSACCSEGVACLSSGLCFDNGLISRGSCTDQDYADEACASACTDFTPTAGAPVVLAGWAANGDVSNMGWCCGFPLDNGTCPQGSTIKIAAGTVYTTAGATSTSTSAPATSSPTSSSTSGSASSTPTQDAANANSTSGGETCEKNNDVAIGAGVGVPLGIAALVCLGMWLRERRLRKGERLEGDLKRGMEGQGGYADGNGAYSGNYGAANGNGMMGTANDRKSPMEMGDGRRPEELP